MVILWWAGRYLTAGYRLSRGEDRARVQWFVSGCVAYLLGYVALATGVTAGVLLRPDARVPITTVAYELLCLLAVLMVAAGVFLQGALDPSLVLKRTTVYGSLVVVAFLLLHDPRRIPGGPCRGVDGPLGRDRSVGDGRVGGTDAPAPPSVHRRERGAMDRGAGSATPSITLIRDHSRTGSPTPHGTPYARRSPSSEDLHEGVGATPDDLAHDLETATHVFAVGDLGDGDPHGRGEDANGWRPRS